MGNSSDEFLKALKDDNKRERKYQILKVFIEPVYVNNSLTRDNHDIGSGDFDCGEI